MVREKIDPHNHKGIYSNWKAKGKRLKSISKKNQSLIIEYLDDMEMGKNISPQSKKGSRSFGRLRNLKSKLHTLFTLFEEQRGKDDITKATEDDLMDLLNGMRKGKYRSPSTKNKFRSAGTYFKVFKAFWNWHMRVEKKKGNLVENITFDLDTRDEKPKFNYFTIDQLKKMCNHSKLFYKTIMMFMFDSGCRSPTELMNIKVSDLEFIKDNGHYMASIPDEASKTFGRKIKLLLSSEMVKEYIESEKLKENDYLFAKSPKVVNEYLNRIGFKYLGIGVKTNEGKGRMWIKEGLTMYDFRHSSACYWLPRYKSESALKYRFGWKKSDMIHYYTEFLGMKDTIQEEDLYVDISKTELEKQIAKERQERELLQERILAQENAIEKMRADMLRQFERKLKSMIKN